MMRFGLGHLGGLTLLPEFKTTSFLNAVNFLFLYKVMQVKVSAEIEVEEE